VFKDVTGFGSSLKRELREKNIGHVCMDMQGSLCISPRKFMDLDPDHKDRYGLNLPRIHLHYEDNDLAMAKDMVNTCEEVIRAAQGEILSEPGEITANELTIDYNHWVGTTRMGHDPRTSVVNRICQSHDVPNLFIGDASVFPAYPEKNPTLTNITLSWRMSDHLVEKFRRGELG
jgi:choline dehydrogenase-like flavoprotein